MSTNMDEILQEISELTQVIKDHGVRDNTVDYDAIEARFAAALEKQRQAIADATPARAGDAASAQAAEVALGSYQGKYVSELRQIAKNGEYRVGNWGLKAVDFWMAHRLMSAANRLKASGQAFVGADKLRPPSEDLTQVVKLMDSTATGAGDELVPTEMATSLWEDFFAASLITSDLPNQPMPSDPFDMPLGLGDITWRKGGAGNPTAAQNMATAKSTMTSTELISEIDWTYNLEEDAIIAMMPALRSRATISGAEQMDSFCLNADATATATGNINLDDDTPASDAYYLTNGQDGIRHLWLVDNTGQGVSAGGDALTDADMTAGLNKLDKYGLNLNSVRIVPGISTYFAMLGLTNVATVEKYGNMATMVRGELARYRGVPILPSVSQPKGEADGKVSKTAASNTLGSMSIYNRDMWRAGFIRGLMIEVDRNIQTRQLIMVLSFRMALAAHGTRSSVQHTSGIYNILV